MGRAARYRYAVTHGGIVKFDATRGTTVEHAVGPDTVAGEAVFVPPSVGDGAEDDGWLLTITTKRDAVRATARARRRRAGRDRDLLPWRVPSGFHGLWIRGAELLDNAVDNDVIEVRG